MHQGQFTPADHPLPPGRNAHLSEPPYPCPASLSGERASKNLGCDETGRTKVDVCAHPSVISLPRFIRTAEQLQSRFLFTPGAWPSTCATSENPPISLYITDRPSNTLFSLIPDRGVIVSTCESVGICRYACVEVEGYLLLCSLLGLTQWKTMLRNPLLQPDDFVHDEPRDCLYSCLETKGEAALLLEVPSICQGCRDFYHYLGVDDEILALSEVLDTIKAGGDRTVDQSSLRRTRTETGLREGSAQDEANEEAREE